MSKLIKAVYTLFYPVRGFNTSMRLTDAKHRVTREQPAKRDWLTRANVCRTLDVPYPGF